MTGDGDTQLLTEFDDEMAQLPASVDRAAVERMRLVAHVLDEGFRVPGIDYRFGIDPVLGILPGAGDLLSGGLSLYIVVEAARLGVSYGTLLRMIGNVALDVGVGSIPILGDAFDVVWKANKRNFGLVVDHLSTT